MISKIERLIAFRYLKPKKKEGFLKVISIFSFTGIALGVAILIIVMSVMNGFRAELINKILGFNAHIIVQPYEKKIEKENQLVTKGIEVGHIFYFGDKYSKPLKCSVDLKDGKKVNVKMGSYGVGVSRLVAAIIEAKFNNNIMRWPEPVSPFDVAIIPSLQKNDKSNQEKAEKIYKFLIKNKIDVLFDDTDEHLSAKFKKFDLLGIPYQIILGSKSIDDKLEFKEVNGKTENLSLEEIKNKLVNKRNLN